MTSCGSVAEGLTSRCTVRAGTWKKSPGRTVTGSPSLFEAGHPRGQIPIDVVVAMVMPARLNTGLNERTNDQHLIAPERQMSGDPRAARRLGQYILRKTLNLCHGCPLPLIPPCFRDSDSGASAELSTAPLAPLRSFRSPWYPRRRVLGVHTNQPRTNGRDSPATLDTPTPLVHVRSQPPDRPRLPSNHHARNAFGKASVQLLARYWRAFSVSGRGWPDPANARSLEK